MNIQCIQTNQAQSPASLTRINHVHNTATYLNADQASFVFKTKPDTMVYLFGDCFYFRDGFKIKCRNPQASDLQKLFKAHSLENIVRNLEGQYFGIEMNALTGNIRFFSDRYAREDVFYSQTKGVFVLSTSLDFIFEHVPVAYDQDMLAHMFAVYGWYTPKGHTMYKQVFQPKAQEILTLSKGKLSKQAIAFEPLPVGDYGTRELESYYTFLRESIAVRSKTTDAKIWVSSSSGWDSSVILGILVDMYGSKRIGMMTGSVEYSKQTGVINQFEINKTKNIGKFYGIKPLQVSLDFKNAKTVGYWQGIAPYLKSKHMYTMTGLNLSRISDGVAKADAGGRIVFNGETSDSFHNFGFSQFATFFHTVKSFTEYSDKMNCYLYGPTFLSKVLKGTHTKDKVYQIFTKMNPSVSFASQWSGRDNQLASYLLPLFYGGPRVPFADTLTNPLLSTHAIQKVRMIPFNLVAPDFLKSVSEKNIYAWIIHLYLSMHSQGSTVNIHKHAMKLNDHRWRSPYNDARMIDLLSSAPESWGRGLDFNHTKHPLKWVAKNKIKFPYELLQEGPHSYLYDVIEGFSLLAEIVYRSGFTPYFKDILRTRTYRALMDPSYFNMTYIDRLVDGYLSGKEVKGQDFNNLFSMVTLTATGWYS